MFGLITGILKTVGSVVLHVGKSLLSAFAAAIGTVSCADVLTAIAVVGGTGYIGRKIYKWFKSRKKDSKKKNSKKKLAKKIEKRNAKKESVNEILLNNVKGSNLNASQKKMKKKLGKELNSKSGNLVKNASKKTSKDKHTVKPFGAFDMTDYQKSVNNGWKNALEAEKAHQEIKRATLTDDEYKIWMKEHRPLTPLNWYGNMTLESFTKAPKKAFPFG